MEIETGDTWISKLSPNEASSARHVCVYHPPLPHPCSHRQPVSSPSPLLAPACGTSTQLPPGRVLASPV